jgi:hypothetical protein
MHARATLFPGLAFLYNSANAKTAKRAEGTMPSLRDFLTFDHFLTPSIIRAFYLLQVVLIVAFGIINILAAFTAMAYSLLPGIAWLICSVFGTAVGLLAARVITEIVMILFKNNEHLAALRARVEGRQ